MHETNTEQCLLQTVPGLVALPNNKSNLRNIADEVAVTFMNSCTGKSVWSRGKQHICIAPRFVGTRKNTMICFLYIVAANKIHVFVLR
jgi:hypothetical protein